MTRKNRRTFQVASLFGGAALITMFFFRIVRQGLRHLTTTTQQGLRHLTTTTQVVLPKLPANRSLIRMDHLQSSLAIRLFLKDKTLSFELNSIK
jgi:hypothetical protein